MKEGLRALPDAIHVQPVSIAGHGDMADAQPAVTVHGPKEKKAAGKAAETPHGQAKELDAEKERLPSASEIARDNTPYVPEHGQANGKTVGNTADTSHNVGSGAADEHLPSASEIARDNTPYVPEHDQGHELTHDMGRSR